MQIHAYTLATYKLAKLLDGLAELFDMCCVHVRTYMYMYMCMNFCSNIWRLHCTRKGRSCENPHLHHVHVHVHVARGLS